MRARVLAVVLLTITLPGVMAQARDPRAAFLAAIGQFSLALDGAYGDEGRAIRSSLDRMARALGEWDAAIRAAETGLASQEAAAEPPVASRMHLALAGAYLDRGRAPDALRELAAAEQRDPTRAEIFTIRGLIQSQLNSDPDAATVSLRKAATLDSRNAIPLYVLGRHLYTIGRTGDAKNAFQLFLKTWEQRDDGKGGVAIDRPFGRLTLVQEKARVEPFVPPVRYADGFALLSGGDYASAIARFREAASRDPFVTDPVEPSSAIGQAAAAFRDGSLDQAVRHLTLAVELEPAHAEPHRLLGRVHRADDRLDAATAELTTAVRLNADDERARLELADVLVEANRDADAEQALRRAIADFPTSGRARYALGRLYQRLGRYEDAIRELEAAVSFRPMLGLNGIFHSIGAMHAAHQNFDAALEAYVKRADVIPNDPDAHQDLGDTFSRLGRHDEALAEYAVTLMLDAGRSGAYASMAQVYIKEGQFAAAEGAARRALALDARNAQAGYALGTSLLRLGKTDEGQKALEAFQQLQTEAAVAQARDLELSGLRREASERTASGDHEKAVSLLRKALAIAPDAAASHLNLGLALFHAGHAAEAIERFQSALALNGPPEVHLHLADAYAALGRTDESRRESDAYRQLKRERLRRAGAER